MHAYHQARNWLAMKPLRKFHVSGAGPAISDRLHECIHATTDQRIMNIHVCIYVHI